jgi:hypothetical protein
VRGRRERLRIRLGIWWKLYPDCLVPDFDDALPSLERALPHHAHRCEPGLYRCFDGQRAGFHPVDRMSGDTFHRWGHRRANKRLRGPVAHVPATEVTWAALCIVLGPQRLLPEHIAPACWRRSLTGQPGDFGYSGWIELPADGTPRFSRLSPRRRHQPGYPLARARRWPTFMKRFGVTSDPDPRCDPRWPEYELHPATRKLNASGRSHVRHEPKAWWRPALPEAEWGKANASQDEEGRLTVNGKVPKAWPLRLDLLAAQITLEARQTSAHRPVPEQAPHWLLPRLRPILKARPQALNLATPGPPVWPPRPQASPPPTWTPRARPSPGPSVTRNSRA